MSVKKIKITIRTEPDQVVTTKVVTTKVVTAKVITTKVATTKVATATFLPISLFSFTRTATRASFPPVLRDIMPERTKPMLNPLTTLLPDVTSTLMRRQALTPCTFMNRIMLWENP